MKKMLLLGVLIILSSFVYADCVIPTDGMVITENTTFCEGEYYLPNGIRIGADNIELDCNGAKLIGNMTTTGIPIVYLKDHSAIKLRFREDVEIKNCEITNYVIGVFLHKSKNNLIENIKGYGNRNSIYLYYFSDENIIKNNYLKHNLWNAIHIQSSSYNLIENNEILNQKHYSYIFHHNKGQASGIELAGVHYPYNIGGFNIIRNNFFFNNYWALFIWGKGNNTVYGNEFKNNEVGVFFFRHPQYEDTTNNTVFANYFLKGGISGWFDYEQDNYFCVEDIGNIYEHGAEGPIC